MMLELPYPPSLNRYWRNLGDRVLISKAGRAYRANVLAAVFEQLGAGRTRVDARLKVEITVYPPDRRRRDLDNVCKAVLDSLAHAGVYGDDSQIDDLRVLRGDVRKPGVAVVRVEPA